VEPALLKTHLRLCFGYQKIYVYFFAQIEAVDDCDVSGDVEPEDNDTSVLDDQQTQITSKASDCAKFVQIDKSTHYGPTSAKKFCGSSSKSLKSESSAALRNVSSVMSSVAKQLSLPKEERHKPNSTRLFCDMLYEQLMKIDNEDEREMMQYEIHGLLLRKKRPRCPTLYNPGRDVTSESSLPYAHDTNAFGSSVSSAISGALSSTFEDFSEWSHSSSNQSYYTM
jgi:hypothetical protein